jgi:hypothetical protein
MIHRRVCSVDRMTWLDGRVRPDGSMSRAHAHRCFAQQNKER